MNSRIETTLGIGTKSRGTGEYTIKTAFSLLGLLADHQVHGSEQVLLRTLDETVTGQSERVSGLLGSLGEETDGLTGTDETVGEATAPPGHAGDGDKVPDGTHVLEGAGQRVVPGGSVGAGSEILVVLELETGVLHGLDTLGDADHVGDTVALLDTETDAAVLGVLVVVLVGHQPLVDTEGAAGLENAEDLRVDANQLGSVHSSLDGVDGVEAVVGELHLHEVALDEGHLVRETLLLGVVGGAVDLVVVVVEAGDVGAGELDNFTCRSADTAADVQNLHAFGDAGLHGKVVLVAGDGLVEGLAVGEAAEVERRAPTVLVEIGGQVVVADDMLVSWCSCLRKGGSRTVGSGWRIPYGETAQSHVSNGDIKRTAQSIIPHGQRRSHQRGPCCPSA